MAGNYRIPRQYYATYKALRSEVRDFYQDTLVDLMEKYGCCWLTSEQLSIRIGMSIRTVKIYLKELRDAGLIIIEKERYGQLPRENKRKIWSLVNWEKRDMFKARFLKDHSRERIAPSKGNLLPTLPTPPLIRIVNNKKENTEGRQVPQASPALTSRIEGLAKPQQQATTWSKPMSEMRNVQQLLPSMQKEGQPPPTPGPKMMVSDVMNILREPIQVGSTKFIFAKEDWPWFFGFSPTIIWNSIDEVNKCSRKGERIHNIPAFLFSTCARLRRTRLESHEVVHRAGFA